MRQVVQPGPVHPDRMQWVEARGRPVVFALEPGRNLLDAVHERFAAEGFSSGVLTLQSGALDPLAYVIPALSPTGSHAAFYSDIIRPPGVSRIRSGGMTFGIRDGAPFFHCHAFWTGPDGRKRGGHVLPDETVIADTIQATGMGLTGAAFVAEYDAETNFTLFGPIARRDGTAPQAGKRVFALRLRPNQDLASALETFCRERGIEGARLHGGVGSIVGASFADGRRVHPFATEMALLGGRIGCSDGALSTEVDAALVDLTGEPCQGSLTRGDNPILMTLEVVLEPTEPGSSGSR
jgi:predicted DNA-binding protein with PD1-like motif